MNSRYDIFPYAFIFVFIIAIAIGLGSFAGNITGNSVIVSEDAAGDCLGIPTSCSTPPIAEEESLCIIQSGCNWISGAMVCNGTAIGCNVYTNETMCGFQSGCNWTIQNICGDGIIDTELEECDDGNIVTGDGCSNLCEIEPPIECFGTSTTCNSLTEELDCNNQLGCEWSISGAAPPISGMPISSECLGNAIQCSTIDIQNDCNNQLGCSLVDVNTVCGNSVVESGEECDDGNILSGDGCSNLCKIELVTNCSSNSSGCVDLNVTYFNSCGDMDPFIYRYTCNATLDACELNAPVNCLSNKTCIEGQCVYSGFSSNLSSNESNNNSFYDLIQGEGNSFRKINAGESCKSSECELGGKCYLTGYRTKERRYCGTDNSWATQKQTTSCLNAFECKSYLCESNTCVQRGFGERASARLSCILGDGTCKGTGGYFSRLLGNEKVL